MPGIRSSSSSHFFTEMETLVFPYLLLPGEPASRTWADPLAIRDRLLRATRGRVEELLRQASGRQPGGADPALSGPPDPPSPWFYVQANMLLERTGAEEQVASAAYASFEGLSPVDEATGEGAPELHAVGVLYDFLDWLEGRREEGRRVSSFVATYGFPPGWRNLGYLDYVRLVLNQDRVRLLHSYDVLRGVAQATSTQDMGPAWADALATVREQADEIHQGHNAPRAEARRRARIAEEGGH
jgi:hypothetical protein